MGSYSGNCRSAYRQTYRKDALQTYNHARAHDGLEPLKRMPQGVKYEKNP